MRVMQWLLVCMAFELTRCTNMFSIQRIIDLQRDFLVTGILIRGMASAVEQDG